MIAIIDLDSTLIDTIYNKELEENKFLKKVPLCGIFPEFISLRPNAKEFLQFCQENFNKVILCTFSRKSRAETILHMFGFEEYFDQVIGCESLIENKIPRICDNFVLIDDAPLNSCYTSRKLECLGVNLVDMIENKECSTKKPSIFKKIDNVLINILQYNFRFDDELEEAAEDRELIKVIERIGEEMKKEEERKQKIFDQIKPIIERISEVLPITRQSSIFTGLSFDEFMLSDLFIEVEIIFGIDIPDELTREAKSIEDILVYVDMQLLSL